MYRMLKKMTIKQVTIFEIIELIVISLDRE